jgi:hypothetical protein
MLAMKRWLNKKKIFVPLGTTEVQSGIDSHLTENKETRLQVRYAAQRYDQDECTVTW